MAASSAIGNVQKVQITSTDSLSNTYTTTLNTKLKPRTANTYRQMDVSARALISLSTNSYGDTHLITDISVNEEMNE